MSSAPRHLERRWSLTARLTWRFAAMTSAIVLLYAAGSLYLLFDALRDDLHNFFEHESSELVLEIEHGDRSPESLQAAVANLSAVTQEPPCAFRIRDVSGAVLADGGRARLLDAWPEPVPPEDLPVGLQLLQQTVFAHSKPVPGTDLFVEVLVDSREMRSTLIQYLRSALFVFLVSVPVAAICGRITARNGLRALRELVDQARAIEQPGASVRLAPEDTPLELRELAAEVNAMLARIDEGLATMRTFTASLAHELRSPLQNLIGETEVALLATRSVEDYSTLLRSNLDDLHELSDAVDNLVAFCRSSEPQPRAAPRERFDLRAEADFRLQRERRSARRAGVELRLAGAGDATLLADREGLLRVLRNLVGNALAWSPRDSAIDVRIDGRDGAVRLCVEDRGPGIPAALAEKVFEPFVSGRPRRGERGGYGLGLTICRNVVREHRGRLWHEPREGGGTRFVAEFPRGA